MRRFFWVLLLLPSFALAQPIPMPSSSHDTSAPITIPDDLSDAEAFEFFAGLSDTQTRALLLEEWRQRQESSVANTGPTGLAVAFVRMRLWLEQNLRQVGSRAVLMLQSVPAAPMSAIQTFEKSWPAAPISLVWAMLGIMAGAGAARVTAVSSRGLQAGLNHAIGDLSGALLVGGLRLALAFAPLILFVVIATSAVSLALAGHKATQSLVSGLVIALATIWAVRIMADFILSPNDAGRRLLAVTDQTAQKLFRQISILTVIAVVFWSLAAFLILTGRPPKGVHLVFVVASGLAVFVTAIWLMLQWRQPVAGMIAAGSNNPFLPDKFRPLLARRWHVLILAYFGIIAGLWTASMLTDRPSVLWPAAGTLLLILCMPLMDSILRQAIGWSVGKFSLDNLPEVPSHSSDEGGGPVKARPKIDPEAYTELFSKAARAVLILFVALAILAFWGFDVLMVIGAPGAASLWRAAGEIFIILVLSYIVWQLVETALTRGFIKRDMDDPDEEKRLAARARTLLPLIRTFLLILLIVIVIMVILSSLGVDIGPLIAGAGVVGIAIGFGAQTLVRDVLSGVFFLIDDAFRVGEYIEMEELRGEVEAITLRSLRLRHHRGHIFTIPFSELRFITNYNRDWVIYKMPIRVPPDTEPALVKRIIKQIGKDLMADPELGPKFIEPLKSQGVYAIDDDSALIIRVKFMCKPREQFIIRREAYHLIRRRFAEHGIEFARRKVEVSVPEGGKVSEQAAASAIEGTEATKSGPDPLAQ